VESFSSTEFNKFSTASLITRSTNDITQIQTVVVMMMRMVIYAPIIGVGGIIRALAKSASMWWIIADCARSIGLRSYGQKDPLQEYKGEAYKYFEEMMSNVRLQICTGLFRSATNLQSFENMLSILARNARMEGPENPPAPNAGPRLSAPTNTTITTSSPAGALPGPGDQPEIKLPKVTIRREVPKVGRNDPCPCGSGKKYKQCHGK